MAGPVQITCAGCGQVFDVPTKVLSVLGHGVYVRMDRRELHGHTSRCPGFAEPATPVEEASTTVAVPDPSQADLAGRIHLMLTGGAFMAKGGSGACTMCGTTRDGCLERLKPVRLTLEDGSEAGAAPGKACCGLCADGNTHPAPMESRGTCAEWGAEHGTPN